MQTAETQPLPVLLSLVEPETLEDLARRVLLTHRIVQQASGPMTDRVLESPELMQQIMRRVVETECRRLLEADIQTRHQAMKRSTGGGPLGSRSSDMTEWAGAVQNALLDGFTLPGGKRLGDASRDDLSLAMGVFQTTATDATIKYRWLQLVQQSLRPGHTVRQSLSEARVAELKEEAKRGDA